jgi:hypothetical protein
MKNGYEQLFVGREGTGTPFHNAANWNMFYMVRNRFSAPLPCLVGLDCLEDSCTAEAFCENDLTFISADKLTLLSAFPPLLSRTDRRQEGLVLHRPV